MNLTINLPILTKTLYVVPFLYNFVLNYKFTYYSFAFNNKITTIGC